jgi:hypothetical protein
VLDEPVPVLEEPVPVLDEPVPVVDEPVPMPVLDEPVPVLDEPVPVLDEPVPVLGSLVVLVDDAGAPLPSVSVSSTPMPGSTLIESLRVPALMTSDLTLDDAQVRLAPLTVATMAVPLLTRTTSMTLACPAVPVHVRMPSTRLGVTVSKSLDSRASSPTNAAKEMARFRFLPLAFRPMPGKRRADAGTRNPLVRFSRAIVSP